MTLEEIRNTLEDVRYQSLRSGKMQSYEFKHDSGTHAITAECWDGRTFHIGCVTTNDILVAVDEVLQEVAPPARGYSCAICGKMGPEHGHFDATDPSTHKFVCGPIVFA